MVITRHTSSKKTNSSARAARRSSSQRAESPESEHQYRKPLAIGRYSHGYFLLVRQTSDAGEHELLSITSLDGTKFTNAPEKVSLRRKDKSAEDLGKCRDFRIFSHGDEMVMTYVRRDGHASALVYAATKDRKKWVVAGEIKKIHSNGVLVPELKPNAGDAVYFGGDVLRVATSRDARSWNVVEPHRVPHWHFFDGAGFRVIGAVPIEKLNSSGPTVHASLPHDAVAVFYEAEVVVDILADVNLHNEKVGEERFIKIGTALFSQEMPTRLLWQTELPLIELPLDKIGNFSVIGVVAAKKTGTQKERTLRIYGTTQEGAVSFIEFSEKVLADHRDRRPATLAKHPNNPIIEPAHHPEQKGHQWESDAAFNPAALELNEKVHLLYRAVGTDGLSRIGYAVSGDGVHIDERLKRPIFTLDSKPRAKGDDDVSAGMFASGGSWGGSEDPKVTRLGDRIYLTYVMHNGYWPMRTALTSISVDDFLKKHWKWKKPVLMSPPNVGSKSVVILPEKIRGQYVVFHRMWPSIMMDYLPDLDFGQGKDSAQTWLTGQHRILPRRSFWDSQKLSMGAAPIKTEQGWLALYSAVDRHDSSKYKLGAMLLDLDHPEQVIARGRKPILTPEEWYENEGKPGVAYPGGLVDLDGMLHIYYGGADRVGCVATISTDNLVWHLLRDSEPRLKVHPVDLK